MLFPFRDSNPTRRTPVVTYGIIAVNVVTFLWMIRLPEAEREEVLFRRGFVPARIGQFFHGRVLTVAVPKGAVMTPDGRIEQVVDQIRLMPSTRQTLLSLLTCMFLHGGWMHLLGNMWFLGIFGDNVEDRLGPVLYLLFYLGGGIVATACQWMVSPNSGAPVIGASGAVAAVLGAYAITWPFATVQTFVFLIIFVTIIDLPALLVLGVWFVGQLLSALQPSGGGYQEVAFWAHIGGFLAGLVLMPWLSGDSQTGSPPRSTPKDVIDAIVLPDDRRPY